MSKSDRIFFKPFIDFVAKNNLYIKNFEYMGKRIGSSIISLFFIGSQVNCSMKELINYLKLNKKPSTATRKIDTLVNLNLVNRKTSTEDRRIINLELSETGKNLYEKILNEQMQRFLDMKNEMGLNNDKYNSFFACLSWLNDN